MVEKSRKSKLFAAAAVVLTIAVLAAIIVMVTFYKIQYDRWPPMPPPTVPPTAATPTLRLPRSLLPSSYRLFIQPHLHPRLREDQVNGTSFNQTDLFTGNSTVYFQCLQSTRSIYLHSQDLNLSRALVLDEDSKRQVKVSSVEGQDVWPHFLEVRLDEPLKEGGKYSLFLAFSGEMSLYLEGLYASSYQEGTPEDEDDLKVHRFVAATNLEPAAARRLFPCFDEPDMRAQFLLTVIHRPDTFAFANTEHYDRSGVGDWMVTSFDPTPKMSTYLLGFIVSQMKETVSTSPKFKVKIRIHARPEAVAAGHTKYAESISGKMSDFFQERFGLGYKMTVIDQVALPDLMPLGMENWGLITYQETCLLYEAGVSSLQQKEEIAITVAHELAHQWFGNLVSIKWWNEMWLKESFATYLSFLAVDHVEPSFNMLESFVTSAMSSAMEDDALASSPPLVVPEDAVQDFHSIIQLYNSITYSKGAMLLRMLENFMRDGDFNKGLQDYLQSFQLQSTDHLDLWASLQEAESTGHKNISEFMRPWISQSGFPVVTINTTSGQVSQRRFLYNDTADSSFLWNVHIHHMSNRKKAGKMDVNTRGPVTKAEFKAQSGEWILANVNVSGFFRVNYNPENWEQLFAQLEADPTQIPLMNRWQIIDDLFHLARAKMVDLTLALNATRFLRHETEFLPWNSADNNLDYMVKMFDRSEVFGPMQTYFRDQVEKLYEFFRNHTDNSTVPEDHYQQLSQTLAVKVACSNGLPACVTMATTKYSEWMNNASTNSIHPNLRSTVSCQAVAAGGSEEWEFAWKMFLKSRDAAEKEQLRHALTCSRKTWLLNRLLGYTLDSEKFRLTDATLTVQDVSQNAAGHALAWNFIRANWQHISEWDTISIISAVSSRFSTQFELQELERFLGDQLLEGEQVLEQTRVNVRWVEENRNTLLHWFQWANEAPPTRQ